MSFSKIFFYSSLSFIFGVFLFSFFKIPQFLIFFLFLFFLFLSIFNKKFFLFSLFLLFLFFGIFRTKICFSKIEKNLAKEYFGKEVDLIGKIIEEPEVGQKTVKLIFLPEKKEFGKILIFTQIYPKYEYGNKIEVKGVLKEPENYKDFDYKNYLAKEGIYSIIYFPEIKTIEKNAGNLVKSALFAFKEKMKESLNFFLSPPYSGLMESLLFGDEEKIPEEWKEKFNQIGIRHITAVSGMNITIITFLIFSFLLSLGFWRNQSFYFSIFFIFLYILMIGAPPSALRAFLMAFLFLIAQSLGRLSTTSRSIVFAATLMLFFNPLLLKYDVGFQLSFLATLGLIYLAPIFKDLFKKIPQFLSLRENLAATLGAQIFTLPILIYNFGKIPIISPLPNILILPFLPSLTILGFFISLFGIILKPIGHFLSLISFPFLDFIFKIVDFFSKIPFSSISIQKFSLFFVFLFYSILIFLIKKLEERRKLKFLGIMI
jgi:competence protein ComEC